MESIITIPPKITKELIENKISQETLMSTYYGVPIRTGLFKSKFRPDSNPTVCYYKNSTNKIIVKDFGSDFCGDWLYVVMHKFNCTFSEALHIAANDFGIIKDSTIEKHPIKESNETIEPLKSSIIQVEIRDFQQYELDWWFSYGITEKTLKKFRVFSCKNIWLNNNLFHLESSNQRIFGYYGGIKNGIEMWRIYNVGKKKYKFISNWKSNMIQGAHMIPKNGGDLLVITKSLKDVMVFYEFGITAIAPNSENLFVSDKQLEKLKKYFKNIVVFYDNDIAGVSGMNKIKKSHPELKFIFIPRKYEAKDISDYYKKYGKEKTLKLINDAKTFLCLERGLDHIIEQEVLEQNKK